MLLIIGPLMMILQDTLPPGYPPIPLFSATLHPAVLRHALRILSDYCFDFDSLSCLL